MTDRSEFRLDRRTYAQREIVWTPGDEVWGLVLLRARDERWIVTDDVGRQLLPGSFEDPETALDAFVEDEL